MWQMKSKRELSLEKLLGEANVHINDIWRLLDEADTLMWKLFITGMLIGAGLVGIIWIAV